MGGTLAVPCFLRNARSHAADVAYRWVGDDTLASRPLGVAVDNGCLNKRFCSRPLSASNLFVTLKELTRTSTKDRLHLSSMIFNMRDCVLPCGKHMRRSRASGFAPRCLRPPPFGDTFRAEFDTSQQAAPSFCRSIGLAFFRTRRSCSARSRRNSSPAAACQIEVSLDVAAVHDMMIASGRSLTNCCAQHSSNGTVKRVDARKA
jgi:hypothetical protein